VLERQRGAALIRVFLSRSNEPVRSCPVRDPDIVARDARAAIAAARASGLLTEREVATLTLATSEATSESSADIVLAAGGTFYSVVVHAAPRASRPCVSDPAPEDSHFARRGGSVLVVEGESQFGSALRNALHLLGYDAPIASTVALHRSSPEIVIAIGDWSVPPSSVLEIDAPVASVLITGRDPATCIGWEHVFAPPLRSRELVRILDALVERVRTLRGRANDERNDDPRGVADRNHPADSGEHLE